MYEGTQSYGEYQKRIRDILEPYRAKPKESLRDRKVFDIQYPGYDIKLSIEWSGWFTDTSELVFDVRITIDGKLYCRYGMGETYLFREVEDIVANLLVQLVPVSGSPRKDMEDFLKNRLFEEKLYNFGCWYGEFLFSYFVYDGNVQYGTLNRPIVRESYSSDEELIQILVNGFYNLYRQ